MQRAQPQNPIEPRQHAFRRCACRDRQRSAKDRPAERGSTCQNRQIWFANRCYRALEGLDDIGIPTRLVEDQGRWAAGLDCSRSKRPAAFINQQIAAPAQKRSQFAIGRIGDENDRTG